MRILFAWELGAGMGHLSPHRPLLEKLRARGHEIQVVVRDVGKARRAFADLGFPTWQAPIAVERPDPVHNPTATFAQVLHNGGFDGADGMLARTEAWDRLLATIQPDLILSDYAPTLLLTLRKCPLPTVIIATGFFVPPRVDPLPIFWPMQGRLPPHVATSDAPLLALLNQVLEARECQPLECVADLFHEGVLPLLKTYPELDHYPQRQGGVYVGCPPSPAGLTPRWPQGDGPRIFAYLKAFKGIETFLSELTKKGCPTLIASDGIPEALRRRFAWEHIRFETKPIDLWTVTETCSVGITNGNQGSTSHLLLAKKPVLMVPLHLEQQIIAANVTKLGAGFAINPETAHGTGEALGRLLQEPEYAAAATRFAESQESRTMERHFDNVLDHLKKFAPI